MSGIEEVVAPGTVAARGARWHATTALAAASEHLVWVLLILLMGGGLFVRGFWGVANLTNVLWAAAPTGLMVLGLFFVMLTGGLDLSLESTFAAAPTIAAMLMLTWAPALVPPPVAIVVTCLLGFAFGLFNGVFSVRLGVNPFLVTLATLIVLRGVVIYLIPEGVYYLPEAYTFLGRARVGPLPVAIVVLLVIYGFGYLLIERHFFGKNVYAIGNNERAAYVAGINVARTKIIAFALAGLFAAVGGLLEVGRLQSLTADMGEGDILMVFAAAVLGGTSLSGGKGRILGILGAVLVLEVVDNLMNLRGVEPSIREIVFGLILLGGIYVASLQGRFSIRGEA